MREQVMTLLETLHSPEDEDHQAAYQSLVHMGPDAVPALLESFPGTTGRARLSVIRILGDIGDARAVALLLELVRSRDAQEYLYVSSLAAKSLGLIGAREGASADQAIAGLIEMLADETTGPRRMSALVLGNLASGEAVPPLIGALGDADRQVRALAARALGLIAIGSDDANRAVPALIVRLRDHDKLPQAIAVNGTSVRTVSEAAAWALEQIDTPDGNRALDKWRSRGK